MPVFRAPTIDVQIGKPEELWWVTRPMSKTLVKYQGQWRWVQSPQEDFLATCEVVLRGGYVHQISNSLAADLEFNGFGDYITET